MLEQAPARPVRPHTHALGPGAVERFTNSNHCIVRLSGGPFASLWGWARVSIHDLRFPRIHSRCASKLLEALGSMLSRRCGSLSTLTGVRSRLSTPLLEDRRPALDGLETRLSSSAKRLVRRSPALCTFGLERVRRPNRLPPSLLDIRPNRNGPTRGHYPSACSLQKVPRAR